MRLFKEISTEWHQFMFKEISTEWHQFTTATFDYHLNGQIASATRNGETENFTWDGLALIHRGNNTFINEPYVTGGNPLLSSKGGVMFNDMLGSTLGVRDGSNLETASMSAFGESSDNAIFFTGKPKIDELGYAFLFRNYRAEQGKWQTADPLGYPDGWNNLAYVTNKVIMGIDAFGTEVILVVAPGAVGGFGHAAGIFQQADGTYKVIDFGGSSGTNPPDFNSVNEAFDFLQKSRPESELFSTRGLQWDFDPETSQRAYENALSHTNNPYAPVDNNCYGVLAEGILSQNGYIAPAITPNGGYMDTLNAMISVPSIIPPGMVTPTTSPKLKE